MQPRHIRSGSSARPVSPPARATERPTEKPVDFYLNLPGAKTAAVAGSFNGWDLSRTPLKKDSNGGWKTTVWLPPGRYEYRFVIDGAQWCSDPGAKESVANNFGSTNSVVVV
jgi:1,4-alpha-glucan branching enzyme